jgi:hypothetical protein
MTVIADKAKRWLYIFLDEAGNFDFSPKGTRYFVLSGIVKERPFHAYKELIELKYNLVEEGVGIEYFHAAEDNQATRNRVFDIIEQNLQGVTIDAVLVEKAKVAIDDQHEERFYPKILGLLIREILNRQNLALYNEVIVFTDNLPVNRKRAVIEKAVKKSLSALLPSDVRYRILHHASKSNMDLQISDYCTWALYRKWNKDDDRSYKRVRSAVRVEWNIHDERGRSRDE